MKLSRFRFELPKSLIAKYPTKERDESRLMVIDRSKKLLNIRYLKIFLTILAIMMYLCLTIPRCFLPVYMEIRKKQGPK
jgi:S-adenosylmethionine:tRNA-ribosyltransferase-isomerase (queuine synthetase)